MENTKQPDVLAEPADDLFTDTPIGIIRSMQAFLRDLPALLANPKYDRWWAAYTERERIGLARSKIELIRKCKDLGLPRNEYYIGIITPKDPEEWAGLSLR